MKGKLFSLSLIGIMMTLFVFSLNGAPCLMNADCPAAYYCAKTPNGLECIPIPDFGSYCHAGGIGSTECSIAAGVEIVGMGVSAGCSVKCGNGFYSCCSLRCICILQR